MGYGLRLINNNATSGGNGRDWIQFGDEAFRKGRARAGQLRRAKQKLRATQRAESSLGWSQARQGSRASPGLAVIRKWHRVHMQPSMNDREGLIDARPPPPLVKADTTLARSTRAIVEDPMLSWRADLFQKPTFPVPQFHYHSMPMVAYAKIPTDPVDAPQEAQPDLSDKNPEKYYFFSDPMITRSHTLLPEHPSHGLAKSKTVSAVQLRSYASQPTLA
ncbi:unnamed protein product [Effrenium voratum]|nr:unnamed protein product [Effrenium voratum]